MSLDNDQTFRVYITLRKGDKEVTQSIIFDEDILEPPTEIPPPPNKDTKTFYVAMGLLALSILINLALIASQ